MVNVCRERHPIIDAGTDVEPEDHEQKCARTSWDDGKAPEGVGVGVDRACLNKGHPQVTRDPGSRLG
jgi:hypothetical protein